ncbi:hypothetical protein JHK86_042916 [Glycine max]|nr:hypothetical protein JHK86_042916 [Glycine max]
MEPCISEYGVMGMDDQRGSLFGSPIHAGALHIFKEDVYGFGVILLELVTGKLVKDRTLDSMQGLTQSSAPFVPPGTTNATLVFEVELVACQPRKGSSLGSVSKERARLE